MATAKKTKTRKKAAKRSSKKSAVKPGTQGTCFVMMPFKDPFGIYYDAIFKPAISKAELAPIRADDLFRPSVIVSDLWQMIQEAKVLLAELTTKNANVFYELGLAHAIGKPVVLVSETMEDVPFDLQQLRILLYNKNDPAWGEKLSKGITNAIIETLDSPIEAVPSVFRKTVASQAPEQDATVARLDALETQVRILRTRESRQVGRDASASHMRFSEPSKDIHSILRKYVEYHLPDGVYPLRLHRIDGNRFMLWYRGHLPPRHEREIQLHIQHKLGVELELVRIEDSTQLPDDEDSQE